MVILTMSLGGHGSLRNMYLTPFPCAKEVSGLVVRIPFQFFFHSIIIIDILIVINIVKITCRQVRQYRISHMVQTEPANPSF